MSEPADSNQPTKEEIDPTSEHFNPLKALYAKEKIIPVPNAKVYDNLAAYVSAYSSKRITSNPFDSKSEIAAGDDEVPSTSSKKKLKKALAEGVAFERKFLPHQGLVQGRGPKARNFRNVMTRMDNFDGPLLFLKKCLDSRQRVKILTRKEHGILGYITGFIEVFDKHFNIVLSDVLEVWQRKKLEFCDVANLGATMPSSCESASAAEKLCLQRLAELKVTLPQIKVKSLNRKKVECTRHLPQLLIRGEQIAVVMLDNTAAPAAVVADEQK